MMTSFLLCFLFYWTLVVNVYGQSVYTNDNTSPDMDAKCVLSTVDSKIASKVDEMIDGGAKVIYIYFNFNNFSGPLLQEETSKVYRPLSWVWTLGRHGRSLLLLRPQYEVFSLTSLSLGTEMINVKLQQNPSECLTKKNVSTVEQTLRTFLFYKFKLPSANNSERETLESNQHICNLQIVPRRKRALFFYECCHKNLKGQTVCQELKSDKYLTILFMCIFLMNFFAIMFSPMLIPAKLYRKKYLTTTYEHKLRQPITLTIKKTSTKSKEQKSFSMSYFDEMPEFKKTITGMISNVRYNLTVSKIHIITESVRLLSSNYVPVGLFESLRSSLVDCEIRKKPSMKDCCHSNVLGPCRPCKRTIPWFKILKKLMHLIMYIFIGKVWIVRLHFFYEYEETERLQREKAASQRGLSLGYTGDLTWYLTPLHVVFVVCYCIFVIDVLIFGIISAQVKGTLKSVMRKCLRDMRELSTRSAFGWSVQILLFPFKQCGVFGILFAWLYYIAAVPVVVLTLAFYCLPTVNILIRLCIYFVAYLVPYGKNCVTIHCTRRLLQLWNYVHRVFRLDILTSQESMERPAKISTKNRILQLVVILACLLTIMSFVVLAMECIVFLVEILMYTLIGVIINASHTLKYLSLVFLLGFYARDCFSTVTQEYLSFNKFLNGYLVDKMREKVEKITRINHELQQNTAFQVSLDDVDGNDDVRVSLYIKDNKLKWEINRLILFLDKNDTPYITSKFFFDTCYLEQAGVPGPLVGSLLRAMGRFILICIFLFFVVIVILSFGDEYGISATNQMFATLAGGFLPYILRFVLFKQPEPMTVDPNNLSFKSKFQRKIEDHRQTWLIADIHVDSFRAVNSHVTDTDVVADDGHKSEDSDMMLAEIKPEIDNDGEVDILIYNRSFV